MADGFLERANQFFLSRNYPRPAAAALAANAVAESGGNTRAVHDQGTGVGLYGFRDPIPGQGRRTALMQYAHARGLDPYAEATQLAYADHELNTTEKAAGDKLKAAKDYREATNATVSYLRPQGYSADNPTGAHNYGGRYNTGAALAGVEPIKGFQASSAYTGGDPDSAAPPPTTGLLGVDMAKYEQLQAQQAAARTAAAEAAKSREQDAEYAALQKQGMGLLEQNTGQSAQPPQFLPPPQLAQAMPQQEDGMPDFRMRLAQQRLARRV